MFNENIEELHDIIPSVAIMRLYDMIKDIYKNGKVEIECDVYNKDVLVVDDLYQSGATMCEYAKYLKSLGAKSVWGLVCVKSLKDMMITLKLNI